MTRYSYAGNDPVNLVDPSGLLQCFSCVLITVLITLGKPDVEIDRQVLRTFCIGSSRDPSQKIVGETKWDGTKITRTDRVLRKATDAEMKANPKVRQQRYDDCMEGKYAALKKEFHPQLEEIMSRGIRNAALGGIAGAATAGQLLGPLNGLLLGAAVTYPNWRDAVIDFEGQKLGPAREKAKAECRKEAGMTE
jgi:hypothetical protein